MPPGISLMASNANHSQQCISDVVAALWLTASHVSFTATQHPMACPNPKIPHPCGLVLVGSTVPIVISCPLIIKVCTQPSHANDTLPSGRTSSLYWPTQNQPYPLPVYMPGEAEA